MKTVPVLIAVALYFGLSFAVYTDDITQASVAYSLPGGGTVYQRSTPGFQVFPGTHRWKLN